MTDTSVVVVTYLSADTITDCLRSIPTGPEIIVIDNASRDASVALAEECGAKVVRNPENIGYAAAANQGARLATAGTLLFLNPDAQLAPDCLARLEEALDSDVDLAAVGPAAIDSNGQPIPGFWPFPRASASWMYELGVHRFVKLAPPRDGFVVGTCLLVRRAWFDRLGGFDEDFWLYGEDADFCRRALAAGGRVAIVDGAAIQHVSGHSTAQSEVGFDQFHRGADLFIRKHHGAASLVSHRIAQLVGALARAVLLWPRDRARSRWFARKAVRALRALLLRPTSP